jgi:hypothetical protein
MRQRQYFGARQYERQDQPIGRRRVVSSLSGSRVGSSEHTGVAA